MGSVWKPLFIHVLVLCLFFTSLGSVFAQTSSSDLNTVIARVRLTKSEVITRKDFSDKIAILEKTLRKTFSDEEKKQFLQALINEILFYQAAERKGITVTEEEVLNAIRMQLAQVGFAQVQTANREELKAFVEQKAQLSWNEYYEDARKAMVRQKYFLQEAQPSLGKVSQPGKEEVQRFYEANKANFFNPEMIKFAHIFLSTAPGGGSLLEVEKKIDEIYKEVTSGALTFEKAVEKYSQDQLSSKKGGVVDSFLVRDNELVNSQVGNDFVDKVFTFQKGQVEKPLRSAQGYHLVKVLERYPARNLTLVDTILPEGDVTVESYIKGNLFMQKQQEAALGVEKDLRDSLMKESSVEIFDKVFQ